MKAILIVFVMLSLAPPGGQAKSPSLAEPSGSVAHTSAERLALLTGKVRPKHLTNFVKTHPGYFDRRAKRQFEALMSCAGDPACSGLKQSLPLYTCSQFRSHKRQAYRWLGKMERWRWIQNPALRLGHVSKFLALPGTSRHHWGTDLDISPFPLSCKLGNRFFMTRDENVARCGREQSQCLSLARQRISDRCQNESTTLNTAYERRLKKALASCKSPDACARRQARLKKEQRLALADEWASCGRSVRRVERHCQRDRDACPTAEGLGASLYQWMEKHAASFHYCQPYKGNPETRNSDLYTVGYEEERWHWSYCCGSEPKRRELSQTGLAPTLEEVFGPRKRWRHQSAAVQEAYQRYLQHDLPQFIANTHPSCQACAETCPDAPKRHAQKTPVR